jgi:DNA-binding transcriptional LysR family regulator
MVLPNGSGSIAWDDARIFLAVARHGSLRAAGRALGLSQPTVGRRLAAFEKSFGGPTLFDRLPDGLRLNPAGEALVPAAERLESAALALERRRVAGSSTLSGTVRVSVGEWAENLLARHCGRSEAIGGLPPGITLELVDSPQTANLARRDADLALRHGVPEAGNLFVTKVGAIAGALYRRRDSRDAASGRAGLGRGEPWITYTEEQAHHVSARWLDQQIRNSGGRVVLRASALPMRVEAIRAGAGIGLLPCYAGDGDPLLKRVTDPVPELAADYWLIVHRDLRRAACVRAVMEWIRGIFDRHRGALAGTAAEPPEAADASGGDAMAAAAAD